MAIGFSFEENAPFYKKWLDKFISRISSTNNPKNVDKKSLEHLLYEKKNIEKNKLPKDKPPQPRRDEPVCPCKFGLYLKWLLSDEPISPPAQESIKKEEIAEDSFLDVSTASVVYDMVANAYSHLSRGDYESAIKQLRYLKSLDLTRVLDGDDKAIESTKKAITDLEEKLI